MSTPAETLRDLDARVMDAEDEENSGPPELRAAVIIHRARVAQALAAIPLPEVA